MGEDVNLAARLESVPPLYGCLIVAEKHTLELAQNVFLMRELDWLLCKGADKPMSVYQPIAELASLQTRKRRLWRSLRERSNTIERDALPTHARFADDLVGDTNPRQARRP